VVKRNSNSGARLIFTQPIREKGPGNIGGRRLPNEPDERGRISLYAKQSPAYFAKSFRMNFTGWMKYYAPRLKLG
jgi:hypothetical protein